GGLGLIAVRAVEHALHVEAREALDDLFLQLEVRAIDVDDLAESVATRGGLSLRGFGEIPKHRVGRQHVAELAHVARPRATMKTFEQVAREGDAERRRKTVGDGLDVLSPIAERREPE